MMKLKYTFQTYQSFVPSFASRRSFSSNGQGTVRRGWTRFVSWTTKPQPEHIRWSFPWFREQTLICTVFAITGSSSMYLVRPFLPKLGLEGSFREGPWSYRIGSFVLVSPIYTFILLFTGSIAGRHNYFAAMARKMWGRFLPAPLAQKVGCTPAKSKLAVQKEAKSVINKSNSTTIKS